MHEECPFNKNKKLKDTHLLIFIPVTCSGEYLTVDSQFNPK